MAVSETVRQHPEPGRRHLAFRGDVVSFYLTVDASMAGSAWLRTNIGAAAVARQEIIRQVDANEAPLHQDWFDIAMAAVAPGRFELTLPLCDVGHFEAKAYFLPDADGHPVWPPGENTAVNVEPAESVCGNIIYNAFIRQFGPNKDVRREPAADTDFEKLDERGYTVIPPSGTFRGFIKELDFIIHELGCRYIQLLPITPTPTTYGRMGRFGSPYAAQSFKLVDTALAEFDPRATPLEQFMELVDAVHRRHAKIILDIAINHTGWGARLHETHPHWVKRADDGTIEVPGAWGVSWEDLTKLDYSNQDLWQFMADVFLTWCRRGVDGFRCDAGYMIPAAAWRYIIACVRVQYPDTIFFLEGLGGKISVTRELLNTANLNWAYSELFQNYDRGQIEHYLPGADAISGGDGIMVHFAETHDNNRLAATSQTYARMRTALCALLAQNGGFAFANGVEWFATEKIDVHDAAPLNWGAPVNQVDHIRRLTTLLKVHPCFWDEAALEMIEKGEGNFIAVLRRQAALGKHLVIVVNLDAENRVYAQWQATLPAIDDTYFIDLLTDERIEIDHTDLGYGLDMPPGRARCLTADAVDCETIDAAAARPLEVPG
ncbi:MAG: alpha-amylase family glycosyl hydrolase, partial [Thermodesulfobacteriota bacterium]